VATVTLGDTRTGDAVVTATVNAAGTAAESVTFIADRTTAKIESSNLTMDKTWIIADGEAVAIYTAIVTDANDNHVSGISVTWSTDLGDLSTGSSETNAAGKAQVNLSAVIPASATSPDNQAQVSAQVGSAAAVSASVLDLVVPPQIYAGPRFNFTGNDGAMTRSLTITGRTGTVRESMELRIKTNHPAPASINYRLTAANGMAYVLTNGVMEGGDLVFRFVAAGAVKPGTWSLNMDDFAVSTTPYYMDWEITL
jgi:adhesin/invasin